MGDVAEVAVTYKRPVSFVRSSGDPVIAINVQQEVGSNIVEVMRGVRAASHLPAAVTASVARRRHPGGTAPSRVRAAVVTCGGLCPGLDKYLQKRRILLQM